MIICHYSHITPIYYSSFHFTFHYSHITPIYYRDYSDYVYTLLVCGFGVTLAVTSFTFTPIMENQMEKKIDNDMETGIIYRRYVGLILCYNLHSLIMGCT